MKINCPFCKEEVDITGKEKELLNQCPKCGENIPNMKKFLFWVAGIAFFGYFLFAIFFGGSDIPSKVSDAEVKLSFDLNMNVAWG